MTPTEMNCPHNVKPPLEGRTFAGPLSLCTCCGNLFTYYDNEQSTLEADGKWHTVSYHWTTDLCQECGGKYIREEKTE